jgi:hypothetical protein
MHGHRSLFRLASMLTALVTVAGCHQSDTITGPPIVARTSTPTPPPVQLAGTWSGRFGQDGPSLTITVAQSGSVVTFGWTSSTYGAIEFRGSVNGSRIRGHLTAERDSTFCPIGQPELTGNATSSQITLSGDSLCTSFDVMHVAIELTR